ncbi:extracellular solute-binding protein [Aquamicrobium sp. LC103]|uniref:ABC transporter substrate-binding protein n=1 Tax=Aquamicrobium sp. LC103 TaxID=1120658 RepID=UPI00063E9B2B|nr:extracellular solute-binding protein [Aquamicrobium sp. LC103]TKT82489.1 extracellular solute-binding protein [Aquamicrobium sp. LC103]
MIGRLTLAAFISAAFISHTSAETNYTPNEQALYEAAKSEGSVTWYVSQYNTENADTICSLFSERYPGVACNPVRSTGQVAFQRIQQELQAGALQADVFSTNEDSQVLQLKGAGQLLKYVPENLQHVVPRIREMGDPDGYWVASGVSPVVILYNTKLVPEEEAPRNWTDLYDPKWKSQVAIGHPSFSGAVGVWATAINDLYGWEFFEKLEQNQPHISRSILDAQNLVGTGERKISIASLSVALQDMHLSGAPTAMVAPTDGMVMPVSVTSVLDAAQRPNAGKLLQEFLLSVEVSEYLASIYRYPLRPEVEVPKGSISLDEPNLIFIPAQEALDKSMEIQGNFRDTFGI